MVAQVYLASAADADDGGAYHGAVDPSTGRIELERIVDSGGRAYCLALSTDGRTLYSGHFSPYRIGSNGDSIRAYHLPPEGAAPALAGNGSTGGQSPCYLAPFAGERAILVANHSSGDVARVEVSSAKSFRCVSRTWIEKLADAPQANDLRPHCVRIDPRAGFVYVSYLGSDDLVTYRIYGDELLVKVGRLAFPPQDGPRHLALHPRINRLYLASEYSNTVTTCEIDRSTGELRALQRLSTLGENWTGERSFAGDVQIAEGGKFLYVTNRGQNTIAGFRIDPQSGELSLLGLTPCRGDFPWALAFSPSNAIALATNHRSNEVVSFFIDPDAGSLEPTGHGTLVPAPTYVLQANS